jgi:hypothetical protein
MAVVLTDLGTNLKIAGAQRRGARAEHRLSPLGSAPGGAGRPAPAELGLLWGGGGGGSGGGGAGGWVGQGFNCAPNRLLRSAWRCRPAAGGRRAVPAGHAGLRRLRAGLLQHGSGAQREEGGELAGRRYPPPPPLLARPPGGPKLEPCGAGRGPRRLRTHTRPPSPSLRRPPARTVAACLRSLCLARLTRPRPRPCPAVRPGTGVLPPGRGAAAWLRTGALQHRWAPAASCASPSPPAARSASAYSPGDRSSLHPRPPTPPACCTSAPPCGGRACVPACLCRRHPQGARGPGGGDCQLRGRAGGCAQLPDRAHQPGHRADGPGDQGQAAGGPLGWVWA